MIAMDGDGSGTWEDSVKSLKFRWNEESNIAGA